MSLKIHIISHISSSYTFCDESVMYLKLQCIVISIKTMLEFIYLNERRIFFPNDDVMMM